MMKSPRKRRGARAAAHSTRRNAAPARRRQIRHENPGRTREPSALLQGWLAPPGAPGRAAGSQGAPCEQRRAGMAQATPTVDIQGRSSLRAVQTETHADLQCIGSSTGADALGHTRVFLFFGPLGLKGS